MKKLHNIDVLYSLLYVNNEHLNSLAQEKIFSNILNFVPIDNVSSIDRHKIDRFCIDILAKIRQNVECFILEPVSMKRILLAADYPNLTELKLFNFDKVALNYFTNESPLRYIFEEKITKLTIENNDPYYRIGSLDNYNRNVYQHILKFFKNLKHLSIIGTLDPSYPHQTLSICDSSSTAFFSLTLTYLCINVYTLDDCLYLLDGRLKQLTTFIIRISIMGKSLSIIHNMDDLPNLKCFSFKCCRPIDKYD
ncbi:unnamed protein product [Rotaria sp. Silwood2]|nr:unnamed protein product [Rotaria sp. Silwood2]CAF2985526.1 unnamed protein product [Rotaria sp. Silwood2]CAF3204430.1 unnamed protein product [Rotaria sp. Silwood2]CAF3324502.1 unnamed protein product [Rotaria sp. Silwood2]CAF4056298.1 unnamed protein product [Rotaria sp. Silwood2]